MGGERCEVPLCMHRHDTYFGIIEIMKKLLKSHSGKPPRFSEIVAKAPDRLLAFFEKFGEARQQLSLMSKVDVLNAVAREEYENCAPRGGTVLMKWFEIFRDIYILRRQGEGRAEDVVRKNPNNFTTFARTFEPLAFLPDFWFAAERNVKAADVRGSAHGLRLAFERYLYEREGGGVWGAMDWEMNRFLQRRIYETLADRDIMNHRTTRGMERTSLTDVRVTGGAHGPLYRSLVVEGQCPGLTEHGLRCEVKLYADQPRVELDYAMRPTANTNPIAYYVAFPFTGRRLTFDVQGGFVRPGENQLEGTASEWNTIQHFVSARADGYQVLLSSKEVPLVQLGHMLDGPFEYVKHYDRPHVYSWVTNNYWVTNFRASQEGEMQWHYTLTSRQDNGNTEALRFALGDRVQAYARVLPVGTKDNRSMESSFLTVEDDALIVTSISPAQKKGYVILQVRETSGRGGKTLRLTSQGKRIRFDRVNALEEVQQKRLREMPLSPQANVLVRVKTGR